MKVWIQRYTYIKLSKYLLLKFYTFHYTLTILVFNLDVDAIYLLNNISCFNENKDLYSFLILYNWHISCNKEKAIFPYTISRIQFIKKYLHNGFLFVSEHFLIAENMSTESLFYTFLAFKKSKIFQI